MTSATELHREYVRDYSATTLARGNRLAAPIVALIVIFFAPYDYFEEPEHLAYFFSLRGFLLFVWNHFHIIR